MKERGNNLITLPMMLRTMMHLAHEAGLHADEGFRHGSVDFYFASIEATRPYDEFISVHLQPAFDLLRIEPNKPIQNIGGGHYSQYEWKEHRMIGTIIQLYDWTKDELITRVNILRDLNLDVPNPVSPNVEPQLQEAAP